MTPMIFWGSLAVTLTVGVAMGIAIARYRASASESQEHAARALVMRHELRRALDRDEFVLHYQPTIELGTDLVSCLEALVRWQHPERGLLMPSQFLSVAEQDFELMGSLTSWVLRRALADHVAWTKAGHDWAVAVNISAPDLALLEFADTVGQILAEAGVRPDRLHLEVAETELAFDTDLAGQVVGALAAQGILMSIDDFGIGYTSLSQLRTLQVSEVKIDRMFVARQGGNEHAVDLDLRHLQGAQLGQARVADAEVVDGHQDALCGERTDDLPGQVGIERQLRLGHLKVEPVGPHPRLRQDLANGVGELQRREVWGGDVDRDLPVAPDRRPRLVVAKRASQHPARQGPHQLRVLRCHGQE